MLPALDPHAALHQQYIAFLDALQGSDFGGDIERGYASRVAVATDNSIYQQLPQAVVFPTGVEDLEILGQVATAHPTVCFSARGGGTGTNGQSLTAGIVVDMSRHMNRILEIDAENGWVRVQCGVVKDQLNDALRPHGYFFAPDLSTSNRATIGGMINTDASGQGSLVYGKTSDHVLELTSVLADGTRIDTAPMGVEDARRVVAKGGPLASILQQALDTCLGYREQVLKVFPRLNRFLTGYDLEHAISDDLATVDVSRLITGSEGSLAFVAEAKLNITPIQTYKALVNVKYDSFESALRHAPHMVAAKATSVETVDSKVLNLAKQDIVWHSVADLIKPVPGCEVEGLNMVEYNSNDQDEIKAKIAALETELSSEEARNKHGVIGFQVTFEKADIGKIYAMRKKAVGLLGKADGWQKPIAFAEDTAVPPENLADFIMEFRALLDKHDLAYGMFGHVDAGVLHVRPALDMCDPKQAELMASLSDQVVSLVAKYGGLMWGEHGKGYRSEYGPAFFGPELFTQLRAIKGAFDPLNRMNPGKICTPLDSDASLVRVTDPKRGDHDRQIPIEVRNDFAPALSCNGNGLCFNYDTSSPMCPSSKITADRRHSPKGRASMMREWLRLLAQHKVDVHALEDDPETHKHAWFARLRNTLRRNEVVDFSHEVKEVMDGCLACKACATQCPVNVDVPTFRARFLALYYQRYLRPMKDHLVANIERMAPLLAVAPALVNSIQGWRPVRYLIRQWVGYVDPPPLSVPTLKKRLADKHSDIQLTLPRLRALDEEARQKTVLIVQDPFTSFYEAELVEDCVSLLQTLGYRPCVLPFRPNGKPQHVKGFLQRFEATAKDSAAFLNEIADLGLPMIGLDASLVLCYRDEYTKALGEERGDFNVQLFHEWFVNESVSGALKGDTEYALFGHCTEKTALPSMEKDWQTIFDRFGLKLQSVAVGCCGMAGTYGHEAANLSNSVGIYKLSWQQALQQYSPSQCLATGFSCRSQVKRIEGAKPRHPLQALLAHLTEEPAQ
ncbi:FAD-binding oxidoreductase [Aestuariibacter halophilus]|uniref:FAD-binding oxidoreductase n=1 Tax=Fluctibacter halophilus TaxID=226011 RepID=A0ABS8G474_9ALTE|nr:FAD-binding and (Fe-S)-binding domain-containing protein [Aestuariibacter halophilus]MCC2615325.1 FAD-binding oxidoreductase [Aestuariibacter halophilus]